MRDVPVYYKRYFTYFLFVKFFYMLFAVLVYSKFTKLGDTFEYLSSVPNISSKIFYNSTSIMIFCAWIFNKLFLGTILVHLPFVFLSYYGIIYALKRMYLSKTELIIIIILLSLPSFGVWTSIISKETVGCFSIGIITGYLFDFIKKKRPFKFIEILAIYLLGIFKPQYFIAFFHVFFIAFLFRRGINKYIKFSLIFVVILMDIYVLYLVRHIIDAYAIVMSLHFDLDSAQSTRPNIWLRDGDFFRHMPYGMLISMFGPTFREVIIKPIQAISFVESCIIFGFWLCLFTKGWIIDVLIKGKIQFLFWALNFFLFFWISLVHYPFGALNPGSAIRYRENFYLILILVPIFSYKYFYSKKTN